MAAMQSLWQKKILLGVTGGIAAYKACEIVRRLQDVGAIVRVVMTEGAQAFVTPLTFQALSGHPVATALFNEDTENGMGHIQLARWADAILIAPTSANTLAKLARGQADDLLSAICLATRAPIAIAPAMNQQMWQKSVTQDNLAQLVLRGVFNLGVDEGLQACGENGPGRLLAPEMLVNRFSKIFLNNLLSGKKVVITAGPTQEFLDPVRYLSNPSSGKMGYALAQAALEAGAKVILISGPVALAPIEGVQLISVTSAIEMHEAVMQQMPCELFIATAAVSDYRAQNISKHKQKKTGDALSLSFIPNPDILAAVATLSPKPFCVGFAAETENFIENAKSKLLKKGCDMICVNDVGQAEVGFASEDNQLTVVSGDGVWSFEKQPKSILAKQLIKVIAKKEATCLVAS